MANRLANACRICMNHFLLQIKTGVAGAAKKDFHRSPQTAIKVSVKSMAPGKAVMTTPCGSPVFGRAAPYSLLSCIALVYTLSAQKRKSGNCGKPAGGAPKIKVKIKTKIKSQAARCCFWATPGRLACVGGLAEKFALLFLLFIT
ncbi:MAG: hypothetical protein PHO10_08195 [Gemmiger sp.]|nr:hypothetical protein [Gemmiger sp.]